ncbi:hypothetical protein SAY87_007540 [Trapa incisa]|uniref:Uncharacterized protein n=1 Tax=Trapa incisa TaxID=236973 RepID=A0AAN7KBQ6_9MYRT|nr:hypothetical protein SAY87_007540 [Trapa incisa]
MDNSVHVANGSKMKPLFGVDSEHVEGLVEGEENSEMKALLPPKGGIMSKNVEKTRRKVQWNDRNGNNLAEVLEFQPSDSSESDEEKDSCICTVM